MLGHSDVVMGDHHECAHSHAQTMAPKESGALLAPGGSLGLEARGMRIEAEVPAEAACCAEEA